MTKYINVEKLKALLDAKCKEFREKKDCPLQYQYMADGLDIAERFVDSLQQEQDLIVINKKDWEVQEKFLKNKKFGMPLKQEQQEVDFKIEERKWVHDAVDNVFPEDRDLMSEVDFRKILKDTARHFYELGLNSRKGEIDI